MVQRHQIKGSISCLVINDPHIQLAVLCVHGIHTVNTSALERHLHAFRFKLPGFQLLLHCPHGSSHHSLGALDHILVAGAAFQNGIAVVRTDLIHQPVHDLISLFFRKGGPFQPFLFHLFCKFLHNLVHNISHIHRAEFILCTLRQAQAILEKMGKCTGGKTFQPGSTVRRHLSVEHLCHAFADHIGRTPGHRCLHQLSRQFPVLRTS